MAARQYIDAWMQVLCSTSDTKEYGHFGNRDKATLMHLVETYITNRGGTVLLKPKASVDQ